jgi:4-hydroxyphenylacetate 3-monooxygenase
MGLKEHEQTVEYLVDLIIDVQTVRTCLAAAERDPSFTPAGYCVANHLHLMPGGLAIVKARQRMAELLRIIPGSSLVVAPSDHDLAAPELALGLEESFGGGGYSALQRSALLQMAWDHVSSALDGRESAFELHASGGVPAWRGRLRQRFPSYNDLANAVLRAIDMPMPEVDVSNIAAMPLAPRRPNLVPPAPAPAKR